MLDGIDAAAEAGLTPMKIDTVVKRGVNDDSIVAIARFRDNGHIVRFIEYMDVGTTNGWRLDDVVPPPRWSSGSRPALAAGAGGGELPRRGGGALALRDGGAARSA